MVLRQPNVVKPMAFAPRDLIEGFRVESVRGLVPLRWVSEIVPKTKAYFPIILTHRLTSSDNFDFFGGTPDRKLAKPQCRPPEALIRSPVSHAAPSDARKTMTGAISSGLPNLAPSGVADAPAFPASLPTNPLSLFAFGINQTR